VDDLVIDVPKGEQQKMKEAIWNGVSMGVKVNQTDESVQKCLAHLMQFDNSAKVSIKYMDYFRWQGRWGPLQYAVTGPLVVDTEKVEATANTDALEKNITTVEDRVGLVELPLEEPAPGYIGTAIVYSGEKNASALATKYLTGSQDWSANERKGRLGVSFAINKFADFDSGTNNGIEADVKSKTDESFGTAKDIASTSVCGLTWGFSYKKGGLPGEMTTLQIQGVFDNGTMGGRPVQWKHGEVNIDKNTALADFRDKRKAKGIPYGILRSFASDKAENIHQHLKTKNGADPVYLHSLDADAPHFETLKKGDQIGSWKKILDAYDEIIKKKGGKDMIIGGYNLLAQPEEYKNKDFQHTARANVVDLAIRQAVHQVVPSMTYPTEPNFLIRADTYQGLKGGKKSPWGEMAFEGRNLFDSALASKGGGALVNKGGGLSVEYDPLASVPTGVKGGGERLKIETNKKYDENSLHGKPQQSPLKEGNTIPLEEQYIVQAQSWAGASRLASAYIAAYKSVSNVNVPTKPKVIQAFSAVEQMVLALLTKQDIGGVAINADDTVTFKTLPITPILKAIQLRLNALKSHPAFEEMVK
jgi:hypothetical protein